MEFLREHPTAVTVVGVLLAVAIVAWPTLKQLLGGVRSLVPVGSVAAPADPQAALDAAVAAYCDALSRLGVSEAEQDRLVALRLKRKREAT